MSELSGLLIICGIYGIGIAITIAIMRAVFMIPTIVTNLRKQTEVLEYILEVQKEILKNQRGGY